MKRSALKLISHSQPPEQAKPVSSSNAGAKVGDFYDGWLQSMAANVFQNEARINQEQRFRGNRPLTQADLNRVNLSTIRESSDHRHWPPGVFEKFLVADVITRKREN